MQVNNSTSSSLLYINDHKKSAEASLGKIVSAKNEQLDNASLALIADAIGNDIGTLSQGLQNATDATSMMQIADGVLSGLSQSAQDLNVLSVQSNSAALSSEQKASLSSKADAIKSSMQDSINNASFNGQAIFGRNMEFSLGESTVTANISNVNVNSLDINSQDSIAEFMKNLDSVRSNVGSTVNALQSSTNSILTQIGSLSSAKSQLSDADIAKESTNFAQQNIMLNASLIAQAHKSSINSAMVSQLLGS
ncbi:flagellin [Sulfurimonas sp. HSL-1716]|uniref:flagellin n=1 Tax=Hydrocurvibacter sulfurireducens TaxID=3131937 RepID=UPI0031F7AFA6